MAFDFNTRGADDFAATHAGIGSDRFDLLKFGLARLTDEEQAALDAAQAKLDQQAAFAELSNLTSRKDDRRKGESSIDRFLRTQPKDPLVSPTADAAPPPAADPLVTPPDTRSRLRKGTDVLIGGTNAALGLSPFSLPGQAGDALFGGDDPDPTNREVIPTLGDIALSVGAGTFRLASDAASLLGTAVSAAAPPGPIGLAVDGFSAFMDLVSGQEDTSVSDLLSSVADSIDATKTDVSQAERAAFNEQFEGFTDLIPALIDHPGAGVELFAEMLPSLVSVVGATRVGMAAAGKAVVSEIRREGSTITTKRAFERIVKAQAKGALVGGVGASALQLGGSTGSQARQTIKDAPIEELMLDPSFAALAEELGPEEARKQAGEAAEKTGAALGILTALIVPAGAKFLPGVNLLEQGIVRGATKLRSRAKSAAAVGGGETLQGTIEGGLEAVATNIAASSQGAAVGILDDIGKNAALEGLFGGIMGAGIGASRGGIAQRKRAAEVPATEEDLTGPTIDPERQRARRAAIDKAAAEAAAAPAPEVVPEPAPATRESRIATLVELSNTNLTTAELEARSDDDLSELELALEENAWIRDPVQREANGFASEAAARGAVLEPLHREQVERPVDDGLTDRERTIKEIGELSGLTAEDLDSRSNEELGDLTGGLYQDWIYDPELRARNGYESEAAAIAGVIESQWEDQGGPRAPEPAPAPEIAPLKLNLTTADILPALVGEDTPGVQVVDGQLVPSTVRAENEALIPKLRARAEQAFEDADNGVKGMTQQRAEAIDVQLDDLARGIMAIDYPKRAPNSSPVTEDGYKVKNITPAAIEKADVIPHEGDIPEGLKQITIGGRTFYAYQQESIEGTDTWHYIEADSIGEFANEFRNTTFPDVPTLEFGQVGEIDSGVEKLGDLKEQFEDNIKQAKEAQAEQAAPTIDSPLSEEGQRPLPGRSDPKDTRTISGEEMDFDTWMDNAASTLEGGRQYLPGDMFPYYDLWNENTDWVAVSEEIQGDVRAEQDAKFRRDEEIRLLRELGPLPDFGPPPGETSTTDAPPADDTASGRTPEDELAAGTPPEPPDTTADTELVAPPPPPPPPISPELGEAAQADADFRLRTENRDTLPKRNIGEAGLEQRDILIDRAVGLAAYVDGFPPNSKAAELMSKLDRVPSPSETKRLVKFDEKLRALETYLRDDLGVDTNRVVNRYFGVQVAARDTNLGPGPADSYYPTTLETPNDRSDRINNRYHQNERENPEGPGKFRRFVGNLFFSDATNDTQYSADMKSVLDGIRKVHADGAARVLERFEQDRANFDNLYTDAELTAAFESEGVRAELEPKAKEAVTRASRQLGRISNDTARERTALVDQQDAALDTHIADLTAQGRTNTPTFSELLEFKQRNAKERESIQTLFDNRGWWLNRDHKLFNETNWDAPPEAVEAYIDEMTAVFVAEGLTPANAKKEATAAAQRFLDQQGQAEALEILFGRDAESNAAMERSLRNPSPVLRKMLGTYEAPSTNLANSFRKGSVQVAEAHLGRRVFNSVYGTKAFYPGQERPGPNNGYVTVRGPGSESAFKGTKRYSKAFQTAFEGMRVEKKFAQAWMEANGPLWEGGNSAAHKGLKWVAGINARVKIQQTGYSLSSQKNNALSALTGMATADMNSINPFTVAGNLAKIEFAFSPEGRAELDKLIANGVIRDSARSEELRIADEDYEKLFGSHFAGKLRRMDSDVRQRVLKIYTLGDDLARMNLYYTRMQGMENAGRTDTKNMESEASEFVRKFLPTSSKVGRAAKEIGRIPVIGKFVTFGQAMMLVTGNMIKQATSSDPDLRAEGLKQVATMAAAIGALVVQDAIIGGMTMEDEDNLSPAEDNIRLLPSYARGDIYVDDGVDKDGNRRVYPVTRAIQYGSVIKAINTFIAHAQGDVGAVESAAALRDMVIPGLFSTEGALDIWDAIVEGEGSFGQKIDLPTDPLISIAATRFRATLQAAAGSTINIAIDGLIEGYKDTFSDRDFGEAKEGSVVRDQIIWGKPLTLIPGKVLGSTAGRVRRTTNNLSRSLGKQMLDPHTSSEDLAQEWDRAKEIQLEEYTELYKDALVAVHNGLPAKEAVARMEPLNKSVQKDVNRYLPSIDRGVLSVEQAAALTMPVRDPTKSRFFWLTKDEQNPSGFSSNSAGLQRLLDNEPDPTAKQQIILTMMARRASLAKLAERDNAEQAELLALVTSRVSAGEPAEPPAE